MAGTVLENLSTKKLVSMICGLLLLEIGFILIGACIAPQPTMVIHQTATACIDKSQTGSEWMLPSKCRKLHSLDPKPGASEGPNDVVFAVKIPQSNYKMSRWFQYMLTLINLRTRYHKDVVIDESSVLTMKVRLGYSDHEAAAEQPAVWTEMLNTVEARRLQCQFNREAVAENEGFEYDCEPVYLLQLGSLPHRYYLLNIRLPIEYGGNRDFTHSTNTKIGSVADLDFISITQTGGFTKVWVSLKIALFVIMIFPVVWYWKRIRILARKSTLLERIIFGLGMSMLFLNLPLELITIFFEVPWMLLFTDLRQGLFYVVLLSFWLVFTGEHLMDQARRNNLASYKWQLSCIAVTTLALLSFELAERGAQVVKPTATVWDHHSFAMALLVLGALAAAAYLLMLGFLVFRVIRSIRYKRRFTLPPEREKHFKRIVSRFQLLMLLTVFTAGLTVAFFFLEQTLGGMLEEWFSTEVEIASGFFTGVYGLWNVYVFLVLSLYAPSHKRWDLDEADTGVEGHELGELNSEQTQLVNSELAANAEQPAANLFSNEATTQLMDITQEKERDD